MSLLRPMLVICMLGWVGMEVRADESGGKDSQSSLSLEDVSTPHNSVDGNIDEEVINPKMRADSGSKSRYSVTTTLSYTGGALSSPFAEDRPNLSKQPGTQTETSSNIGLNGRYRLDKNNSFTAGSSFGVKTPFEGHVGADHQLDVFDPNVAYNHVGKIGPFQTLGAVAMAYGTSSESESIDLKPSFGASFNALYNFGNGFTAGVLTATDYYIYSSAPGQNLNTVTSRYGHDSRPGWDLSFSPELEYQVNDRWAVRTVFGDFNWKHLYGDPNQYRMLQTWVYQSVGMGITVVRDVYLFPYVEFVPDHVQAGFTNVALSATMNLF